MNSWTRIGLVLLRLVIGWHFLFEGLDKLESWYAGPRDGKPAWSSAGYLSESQGPLAPWFRQQAGEPDSDALARLTLPKEPGKLPAALEADWTARFELFAMHYDLGMYTTVQPEYVGVLAVTPAPFPATLPWPALARGIRKTPTDSLQLELAQEELAPARLRALDWFAHGEREVKSKLPNVAEKITEKTPQRIAHYRKTLDKIQEIETQGMPAFDRDAWKDNYRALKKEAAVERTELLADLNKPFEDVLTVAKFRMTKAQRERDPMPALVAATSNLDRINAVTRWGLAIVGGCLLLGLFTRTACVGGACFLLLFYLAMPALPWLPANPRAEGHYQFIDKNIIEMIALLTLATTQSGRWLGLDGLLQFLNPARWRTAKKAAATT